MFTYHCKQNTTSLSLFAGRTVVIRQFSTLFSFFARRVTHDLNIYTNTISFFIPHLIRMFIGYSEGRDIFTFFLIVIPVSALTSEYDQETPQPHIVDQPTAPSGRATEQ